MNLKKWLLLFVICIPVVYFGVNRNTTTPTIANDLRDAVADELPGSEKMENIDIPMPASMPSAKSKATEALTCAELSDQLLTLLEQHNRGTAAIGPKRKGSANGYQGKHL